MLYFDESGYTGPDLTNSNQPYFSLASIRITNEEIAQIKKDVGYSKWGKELHFRSMYKSYRGQEMLDKIFKDNGYNNKCDVLDCACGIGTQAIGLAALGYNITASDISEGALAEAKTRALKAKVNIHFRTADFRFLSQAFSEKFDIVIAMDNALPHMLTGEDLCRAVKSIADQTKENGIFVGSIRDYDALLQDKPPYSPPYIHKTDKGKRVSFQTWIWNGDRYKLTQYIIYDE